MESTYAAARNSRAGRISQQSRIFHPEHSVDASSLHLLDDLLVRGSIFHSFRFIYAFVAARKRVY